jgi:3'-5' exoribonuclease
MIIELEMLQAKLAKLPGFPPELKTLLEHMIISHHGQYDFGSPKLPMFPEALMLHYLDDLDSKMEAIRAQFEREAHSEGAWTSYNASMGRPLLDSRKFMQGEKAPAAKAASDTESPTDVTETAQIAAAAEPTVILNLFSEQKI